MKSIAQLEAEVELAKYAVKAAQANLRALETELGQARVAASQASQHEWAGKAVKREERQRGSFNSYHMRSGPGRTVTRRGTVVLNESSRHATQYRNYHPAPGEWFVRSPNGLTAYSLNEGWELD